MRPEFLKFFPDEVRHADGAVVVARRPEGTHPVGSPPTPIDGLMAKATWQATAELLATDGHRYSYDLGIVPPSSGEGCDLLKPAQ